MTHEDPQFGHSPEDSLPPSFRGIMLEGNKSNWLMGNKLSKIVTSLEKLFKDTDFYKNAKADGRAAHDMTFSVEDEGVTTTIRLVRNTDQDHTQFQITRRGSDPNGDLGEDQTLILNERKVVDEDGRNSGYQQDAQYCDTALLDAQKEGLLLSVKDQIARIDTFVAIIKDQLEARKWRLQDYSSEDVVPHIERDVFRLLDQLDQLKQLDPELYTPDEMPELPVLNVQDSEFVHLQTVIRCSQSLRNYVVTDVFLPEDGRRFLVIEEFIAQDAYGETAQQRFEDDYLELNDVLSIGVVTINGSLSEARVLAQNRHDPNFIDYGVLQNLSMGETTCNRISDIDGMQFLLDRFIEDTNSLLQGNRDGV